MHADVGTGCKIYDDRPSACRAFSCEWLVNAQLGDVWKPDRAKFYIARDGDELNVFVDLATPDAWRAADYYPTLKRVASELVAMDQLMIVIIGERRIAVLPDRDEDLGNIGSGRRIRLGRRSLPGRTEYLVEAVPRGQ